MAYPSVTRPPNKKSSRFTVDVLLRDYSPEIREIVTSLRQIIRETVPEAAELPKPGWRSISFRHPTVGYFCGIFPFQDRVDLAFEFGVLLPDPDGLLSPGPKQVRYVRLFPSSLIPTKPLARLIRSAVALPEDKRVRVAMVKSGAKLEPPDESQSSIKG